MTNIEWNSSNLQVQFIDSHKIHCLQNSSESWPKLLSTANIFSFKFLCFFFCLCDLPDQVMGNKFSPKVLGPKFFEANELRGGRSLVDEVIHSNRNYQYFQNRLFGFFSEREPHPGLIFGIAGEKFTCNFWVMSEDLYPEVYLRVGWWVWGSPGEITFLFERVLNITWFVPTA